MRLAGHKIHVYTLINTQQEQESTRYNCSVVVLSIAIIAEVRQNDLQRETGDLYVQNSRKACGLFLATIPFIHHSGKVYNCS